MQIVKYETNRNILMVGFKEQDNSKNNFVVYTQIPADSTKTKQELLQQAYKQCKNSIDYEKTQTEHALTTNETGDEFTPETAKVTNIEIVGQNIIQSNNAAITSQYAATVKNQYNEVLNTAVTWSIESAVENVSINAAGLISVGIITADKDIALKATCGDINNTLNVKILKPQVIKESVDDDKVAMAEALIDLNTRLKALENK